MWDVLVVDELRDELLALPLPVQDGVFALTRLLQEFGPTLGRPRVGTLAGSKFANLKELRFYASDGVWRIAFAFDPARQAVLLVAGDKSGGSETRFYRELIRKAEERFQAHLDRQTKA